jgi:hypothetical protein
MGSARKSTTPRARWLAIQISGADYAKDGDVDDEVVAQPLGAWKDAGPLFQMVTEIAIAPFAP